MILDAWTSILRNFRITFHWNLMYYSCGIIVCLSNRIKLTTFNICKHKLTFWNSERSAESPMTFIRGCTFGADIHRVENDFAGCTCPHAGADKLWLLGRLSTTGSCPVRLADSYLNWRAKAGSREASLQPLGLGPCNAFCNTPVDGFVIGSLSRRPRFSRSRVARSRAAEVL